MNNIIKEFEKKQMKKDIPNFRSGDTIEVKIWVFEGSKKRLQSFEGIVIAIRKRGLNSSFSVRKVSNGYGVERVFHIHSPIINSIKVKKLGVVRKSKLYYIRQLTGKLARIKQKIK